jgi:phosphatidylinositol alpha 1,6-mannosyltransferase
MSRFWPSCFFIKHALQRGGGRGQWGIEVDIGQIAFIPFWQSSRKMDNRLVMTPDQLRIALFSGNYNYVRDGANQALNRLVEYLLRKGAAVRVYSPTSPIPAFEPAGDLVSVRSTSFPFGRDEYPLALGLPSETRRDLEAFAPNIVHVSAPDILGHRAVSWARARSLPILASMHTRFETYLHYYKLGFAEPLLRTMLRRFYRRTNAVVTPSDSMSAVMRAQRMSDDISIWTRGIDATIFHPGRRSLEWRRSLGISDTEVIVGFLGRLVMEKGLDVFCDTANILRERTIPHKILVIGEGPARDWFARRLPGAVFVGFQAGDDLGRAVASMDIFFNPSITEAFGNVTQEAMACSIPVVAARATGNESLVRDNMTGRLVTPGDRIAFADAIASYCADPELRTAHGKAGLEDSKANDWDSVNEAVLETYLRIAKPVAV